MTVDAALSVVSAGPLVTLQDAGRFGQLRFGVPASGPMDRFAHAAANVAVGNDVGATAIEVSIAGVELDVVGAACALAIAGGGFEIDAGERSIDPWSVITLEPGERLRLRAGRWGSWAYVAVAGGFRAAAWLGSSATHSTSGRGGGALSAGANLAVGSTSGSVHARSFAAHAPPASQRSPIRVVLGPQLHRFDPVAVERLNGSPYRLTDAYDRMGVRLDGPSLPLADALGIPSEPIVRGSIQVAGDEVATVLLADHQTMGGYPKIATVLSCDLDRFVQYRPGDEVRFDAVEPDEAIELARAHARRTSAALAEIDGHDGDLAARLLATDLVGPTAVGPVVEPDDDPG